MPNYQWLFFDADGTLFDYAQAEAAALAQCLAEFGAECPAAVLEQYRVINEQLWREFEQRQVTADELRVRRFEALFGRLGLAIPAAQASPIYLKYLGQSAQLIPEAFEVVSRLHARQRIAVLTNGLREVQRARLERSPLAGLVDHLIVSDEIGVAKPARQYFEYAMRTVGCEDKSTVLMIGDGWESDIRGAVGFGLDACWYNPQRAARPEALPVRYEIHDLWELVEIVEPGRREEG